MLQRTQLSNGIRVITEAIPHVRSVAIGFWYRAGSRDETADQNGISHFIEHLMFKGTRTRSARDIAEIIDASGGQMNAYTSKEHTCYYARVLDQHVGLALDILADMLRHSVFDPVEIEKEKGVVLEEIKMYEDTPDERVHDVFSEAVLAGHPLGRPVLGVAESVGKITRESVLQYLDARYTGENLVVAAAGNLDHDQIVAEVGRFFSDLPAGPGDGCSAHRIQTGGHLVQPKETEQAHLCVGALGLPRNHPDRFALHVLDVALGGGMSSRFFQELREEMGLVYSTYTYHSCFLETGLFSVYAGTSPSNARQVLELVADGLRSAARDGVGVDEIQRAKEQLKGSLMIGLENTANRMSRIARMELFGEEWLSPDSMIQKIDQVTEDDVRRLCESLFGDELYLAAVGPLSPDIAEATLGAAGKVSAL